MKHRRRWIPLTLSIALMASGCGSDDTGRSALLLRPNGDLLSVGETVIRSESAAGDVMLVGGTLDFTGDVGGSYLGAGGNQQVRGRIEGSARVAGGTVFFEASVGRNITAAGGTVELREDALIERNAYLAGGVVRIDGSVLGDLYVGGSEVVLDGTVGGDARIEAETLRIGPTARIDGDLRYRVGEEPVSIADGVSFGGEVEALPPRGDEGPNIPMYVLRLLAFVVSAGVLVALFPGPASGMVAAVRARPVSALGFGVLWAVGVPVLALGLAITVVGIPLALIVAAVYVASVYLAPAVPAMWLGRLLIPPRGERGPGRADTLKALLVGGPLVAVAIFLPWAGVVVRLATGLLGLGGMAIVLREKLT
jgi:cytoskeletal protein CcmA (bactofilin family)